MQKFAQLGLFLLFSQHIVAHAACKLQTADIHGAWMYASGEGFFEAFEISKDYRFNSWLHDRPELIDASWTLKNCALRVRSHDKSMRFLFGVARYGNHLIIAEDQGSGKMSVATYRKLSQ